MRKEIKISLFFILFLILYHYSAPPLKGAEIAVIPYKVVNPSEKFSLAQGKKYAKYIGLIALIDKGFEIYNPNELDNDLALMGINPNNIIEKDELALLCKSRRLVYVLSGTILKTSKGYRVKSILYSAAKKGIISRSNVLAKDLYKLAALDVRELLFAFGQKKFNYKNYVDAAIIFDTSYNVLREWKAVKEGIVKFSGNVFELWQGSKIYLVPFADNIKKRSYGKPHLAISSIRKSLISKKLQGANKKKGFYNAFSYTIKNINWRKNSGHVVILITNSKYNNNYFLRQFFPLARKKNIKIYTLSLGKVISDDSIRYSLFAKSTRGKAYDAAYYQSLYDNKGHYYHLYMENGHFFQGELKNNSWKRGLFVYLKGNNLNFSGSPGYAEEVNIRDNMKITPYNMANKYKMLSGRPIIGEKKLLNNISDIMLNVFELYSKKNEMNLKKKPLARVMFSSDNMTLWSDVVKKKDLLFLQTQKSHNKIFIMGVQLVSKKSEVYGITLNPFKYIFNINNDYLTSDLFVPLQELIKKSDLYMEKGLLSPSFWFIKAKVEKLEFLKVRKDFRDM